MDTVAAPPAPPKMSPSTRAVKEAAAVLERPGVFPMMLAAFLLCLVLTVALPLAVDGITAMLLALGVPQLQLTILYVALQVLMAAGLVLLAAPLWLGRLYMAGALLAGQNTHPSAVFYYLTSRRRFGRALGIEVILCLLLAVPGGVIAGLFALAWRLYVSVFDVLFAAPAAVLAFAALLLIAAALSLGALYLASAFLPFAAVAVGNEEMPLLSALRLSVTAGGRNLTPCAGFLFKSLLRLLLGLLTVGVLHVLWNSHIFVLSYMRLSMALCPKGEPQ